jgi:hypothetical protein
MSGGTLGEVRPALNYLHASGSRLDEFSILGAFCLCQCLYVCSTVVVCLARVRSFGMRCELSESIFAKLAWYHVWGCLALLKCQSDGRSLRGCSGAACGAGPRSCVPMEAMFETHRTS